MHRFSDVVLVIVTIFFFLNVLPILTSAHPGPVDEHGCHYDEQGRRHCHVRRN